MEKFDIVIIGGGIVGLATALKILETQPKIKLALLEKESAIAEHQTGHNSGVIHSGIYYKPNSLKAKNCLAGYNQLLEFAEKHEIPYDKCGKVIVATSHAELPALTNIHERGIANGLMGLRLLQSEAVREIEPHVRAVAGVWVPQTGIIDYKVVANKYAELLQKYGASLKMKHNVTGISPKPDGLIITTAQTEILAKVVVNCGGLQSDRLTKQTMPQSDIKIIPFRGEYYELKKEKEYLVRNLIYPVPNPDFPFLGVHFTRMVGGGVEAGPNAVLAFSREGYHRSNINISDLVETITYPGFIKIALKYWQEGAMEMYRSFSKKAFVHSLQQLVPEIQYDDIVAAEAGVRAQACNSKGELVDDFLIFETECVINVCNAPSPAATASLAIGNHIAAMAIKKLPI